MTNADSASGHSSLEGGTSIYQLLTPLLRRWRLVLSLPLLFGAAAAAVSLVLPPRYTATTTFTTDVSSSSVAGSLGGLASLAGQIGITGFNAGGPSPDFFAEVLKSRELLRATLVSSFRDPHSSGGDSSRSLLDLLAIRGSTLDQRLDVGTRYLGKRIAARVDKRSGLVILTAEARSASVAASIANRMVELLNQFNLERRQSQSREQRRFAGERLAQAERELRTAEVEHLRFLEANRRYSDAPLLLFEANRLERQVQLRQEIYVTLSREHEQARIAEVRDTPVLTIVDIARAPDRRSFPRRKRMVVFAMAFGCVIASFVAHMQEARGAAERTARPDYLSWRAAWVDMWTQLRGRTKHR